MMEELRNFYRASLQDRITALRTAQGAFAEDAERAIESIRLIAHSLRGSGSLYGFPCITEAAGILEDAGRDGLPAALDSLLSALESVRSQSGPAKRSILVVEDEPVNALLLSGILGAPEREIHVAETAAQALALLSGKKMDLIVLDLVLPDMDGRACLMRIKENPSTAMIPVLVQSGKMGELTRQECLSLGAAAFLHKPYDPGQIRDLAESILAGNASGPEADPLSARGAAPARSVLGEGKDPASASPILLAEDDPLIAKIILHRLGREGLRVDWFEDGEAAFQAVCVRPCSMAILDVKLPVLDGFELLGRIRGIPAGGSLPILLLTSLGKEQEVERGFELGANDYLTKPFSPTELVARVRNLRRPL